MNIELLERSTHMKPLLVDLYDTHRVYKNEGDKAPSVRSKLGDIVFELLDASVDQRERDLVTDMLMALIEQAELDLRKLLAERLSTIESVPSRLILELAYDEIDVADSVLRLSPVLGTLDLMYIIQSRHSVYWQAIASRKNLPTEIIGALLSLKDEPTESVLAGNETLKFSKEDWRCLFKSAKESDAVARPLLERSDIPKALVRKLYICVGDALKNRIEEKYGFLGQANITENIDQIIKDKTSFVHPYCPSEKLIESERIKLEIRTERESQVRSIALDEMYTALKLKKYKRFVAKFSVFMGITGQESMDIFSQKYGHGLAILSKAHGLDRNDFIKIFLLTDSIRSDTHIMQGVTLNRALAYYDRLSVDLSRKLYEKNFLR